MAVFLQIVLQLYWLSSFEFSALAFIDLIRGLIAPHSSEVPKMLTSEISPLTTIVFLYLFYCFFLKFKNKVNLY
jgi:hypothetical protein